MTSMPASPATLCEWFATAPLGQYLLAREQAYYDATIDDVFGFNALQLGLPAHDLLRASRISYKCRLASELAAECRLANTDDAANAGIGDESTCAPRIDLRVDYRDLPIASDSVDLLVLPHVLEFSAHPHEILREVQRVLIPEGHLVIAGFNPLSLWGMRRAFSRAPQAYPWRGKFIHLLRLKDWLALLGFEIDAGRMSGYVPPFTQEKWLHRWRFMDSAGDRWWPMGGGVYFIEAIKRVRGMRMIVPQWKETAAARRERLSVVPEKAAARDDVMRRTKRLPER